jgi:Spy/CpxP family protein refolding chaperone
MRAEAKDGAVMKVETKVLSGSLAALLLMAGAFAQAKAQTATPQQSQTDPAQARANQANQVPDLAQLNLTPEQIQKWRTINAELKDQQQVATLRFRQARRALAEAIESPTSNEELIKQRAKEVSEAQAATNELQALRQARILQMLTPEQRIKLREIRQQNQARRPNNQQLPRNGLGRRQDGLPRNANSAVPLGPKQRKLIRQQQKP